MIRIEPYRRDDLPLVVEFVSAIQEYERGIVPGLKPGFEIAEDYAAMITKNVREKNGVILMARLDRQTLGFVCAWAEIDEDPCLQETMRRHAYVSDIYVDESVRHNGIGGRLLTEIEKAMLERGCSHIRICSKASNVPAVRCYHAAGYHPYAVIFSKALP
jgi:GNAT superfamily N-acetyltransferase